MIPMVMCLKCEQTYIKVKKTYNKAHWS